MDSPGDSALHPFPIPARPALGRRGAIVAPHRLATAAGAAILRQGGNAVDAAIATNAALAVVSANLCGLGGDAFWLIWDEHVRRQTALNGSGRAGSLADPRRLRDGGLAELPARGPLTITVPGAVRSWGDAHERFGRLPFATLLAPAIELAEDGFPADETWVAATRTSERVFLQEVGSASGGWRATFIPDGLPRSGDVVRLPALARTLRRLAEAGTADFYDGEIGERQARALEAAGALITADDLRSHTSTWGEPIETTYRGMRVTTHPPNSSGVIGLEALGILGQLPPPPSDAFGPSGPDARWVHLSIEAAKLALADRDRYLTDPEAAHVPVDRLLDLGYAAELAARISEREASAPVRAGRTGGGTVFLGVVDADGNAVSLIQSNYRGFGSGIADPSTGISYQNRGAYFSLDPTHPNVLGPRKRTLHTLLPAMLFRGDRLAAVVGSMGGDAQPIVLAQVVSALVDGLVGALTAVSAPRVSAEAPAHFAPRELVVAEPRFRPGLLEELEAMGHRVERVAEFDAALGHCHAIEIRGGGPGSPGGSLLAATDPRSEGQPEVL